MDETWAIQQFRGPGEWVTYGAYSHMTDVNEALRLAQEWAEQPKSAPLGTRVIDRHGWTSEIFGGRPCFQPTYNPFTEMWTGLCAATGESVSDSDSYKVCAFGAQHTCPPVNSQSNTKIAGGFSHDSSVRACRTQ